MTRVVAPTHGGRRRVPRRTFDANVGILLGGRYTLERSYQVGEGGMMISIQDTCLRENVQIVLSFFLPGQALIMVRGIVRSVIPAKDAKPERYGIEFLNLEFQSKREIRNFVAAATQTDGHASSY